MDSNELKPDQAAKIHESLLPLTNYLTSLHDRMVEVG